jgi:hypothetical protein
MQELYITDMSGKKSILLRIEPRKLKAIEKWAADEFRSTNAQIEYILDQALRKAGRYRKNFDGELEGEEG